MTLPAPEIRESGRHIGVPAIGNNPGSRRAGSVGPILANVILEDTGGTDDKCSDTPTLLRLFNGAGAT